jgi:cyclase
MREARAPDRRPNRREAIARGAAAGIGALAGWRGLDALSASLTAQGGAPPVTPLPQNPRYPLPPAWQTEFRQLRPNVYAYIQAGGPGYGVVVADDHLLVIDTLGQPKHTAAFKAAIARTFGNKPVTRVVNTHQHSDHVYGNQYFEPAEFVSHATCREMMRQMAAALPPNATFEPFEGAADGTERMRVVTATTTFTDRLAYDYGGTRVELLHLGVGHTWGDTIVHLPDHQIAFVGDVALFHTTPFSHQGRVTTWVKVLETVRNMDLATIVPGHGPIGGPRELADVAEYFDILTREVRKRFDAGMSPGRAAADITMGRFDNWIGSERVLLNTFRLYGELNGTLTPFLDVPGMTQAADEFNAIQAKRGARG